MKTLIVVPAYNEALNIEKTIRDIKEHTKFDYIIINDCSKDNTLDICKENGWLCLYGKDRAIKNDVFCSKSIRRILIGLLYI